MTDEEKTSPEMDEETALAERPEGDVVEADPVDDEAAEDAESSEDGEQPEDDELAEMGLMDHLDELRVRMVRAALAFVVGTCACYAFAEQLFGYLIIPLTDVIGEGEHLVYTGLAEGFITYIKLAAIAGFFATSPFIFYQFWAFVAPGLYKEERRWVVPIALFTALFFVGGSLFGYFKVFPIAFEFFAGFETEHIKLLPAVKEYLSLAIKLLFAFGFAFELPLVIFFLARLGVVSSEGLRKKRKYAILMSFVVGAALTPPDPFSQALMAGPLIVLYEIGIWLAYFFGKNEPRKLAKQAEADEADEAGDSA
ncbi:twin-arginine translocase subunit TatC [Desulfocurvus sp. DL9XJH121]